MQIIYDSYKADFCWFNQLSGQHVDISTSQQCFWKMTKDHQGTLSVHFRYVQMQ